MSLFTLLITQQQRTKNAQILARLGNWTNYMKPSRSISTNAFTGLEQRATREAVKCVKTSTPIRSSRDYRIYPQSVDLDAFFGAEEQKCEKVSDVCLLNDHFILVKMPNEKPATPQPPPPAAAAAVHRKLGSKLPRCFKCNRGSRVSPIMESLEEPEPKDYVPWNPHDDDTDNDDDDDDDVEVFASRTRIIPAPPKPISIILEQPQPQRTPPTPPPPPLPCLQLESLQYPPPAVANPFPVITRGPLHWFLWPFRRRRTRTQQQQQQQLAAVHKTYFIRWNKPPDTLYHGYGVERTPQPEKNGLRRCRSAIF